MLSRMHSRHSAPAISLLMTLLAMVPLTSCGGARTPTAEVPFAQAHAIVQSWWPKEEAAVISGDPRTLTELYAGSALDVATGEMAMTTLRGGRPKYPRPFRGSVIFALASGAGAAWFLAIIQYAPIDQDGRAQAISRSVPGMIFANIGGTWKASVADVQAPIPHNALGNGDSTLSTPLSDEHYLMAASAIATSYAGYLNEISAGQQPDVPFPTGLNSFAWQFTRIAWPPGSIATARFTFVVDTPEVADYSITSGIIKVPEVVLFVLRRSVVIKPRQGCLVRRQDDLQWSGIVPAGSYSVVTLNSVSVVAATVPLNDGDTSQGRKLVDVSAAIDDVSATAAKC
jgi:hypothetical protein